MLLLCIIRNNYCTLPRKIRREKTLGEMWAAVIRTINNLLQMAWLRTRAPQFGTEPESVDAQKGTVKDIFTRCLKKNVAQVCTLLKSCAYHKEEFKLYCQPYYKYRWKTNIQDHSGYVVDIYVNLLIPASILFLSFPMYKVCRVITGVYFLQVKNKPWIPWVYTWSWHRPEQ